MTTHVQHAIPHGSGATGRAPERSHTKPRKFSTFMKRLASLKSAAAGPSSRTTGHGTGRSASFSSGSPSTKQCPGKPPATSRASSRNAHHSYDFLPRYHTNGSTSSLTSMSDLDADDDADRQTTHTSGRLSRRPPPSATTATTSAWSSPTPSMRSLTTTLTTVQSTAPGSMLGGGYNPHPSHHHNPNGPPQMYSAPFDSQHSPQVTGLLHPVSYNAATAHGVWTDNASIITLASSSKRRRRSFDTDASVRALAPSSVFGGSRESLPLSVLSGNLEATLGSRGGIGDRNSLNGSIIRSGDAASLGGAGSIMGEISGTNCGTGSLLASPVLSNRESMHSGRHSRQGSGWATGALEEDDARSLSVRSIRSVRSASTKDGLEGDLADVMSVRDGSSNVGVWNGVLGKAKATQDTVREDVSG